uniref:Seed maturation protein n=2 Tax=Glycine subgen. Glycine TaxID=1462605 RepID=Q2XSH7_GLYTA|nr:seed maturation protein [Glycine tabacina]ABB72400.1 seed maturation protein [Glycine tomentella]
MAKSKEDITYATSQARLSEDEAVRVAYVHGTPLEGGKIADSQPVDLFSSAHNMPKSGQTTMDSNTSDQSQMQRDTQEGGSKEFTTGAPG